MTDEYKSKLKNRLFGLLCEYEKEREWKKFLDAILIELYGFDNQLKTAVYYHLVYNLTSVRFLSYEYFRSTIFDCMNLVDRL